MRVLGIDPGSRTTGWAVVERERGRYHVVASGVIAAGDGEMGGRLLSIHRGLRAVLAEHQPESVAIEAIFAHKSSTSALVLGQARGVALLAAAEAGLSVSEYNAASVKKSVTGSGRADKEQIGRMVTLLVGDPLPGPHDRRDAVALAITHLAHAGFRAAVEAHR